MYDVVHIQKLDSAYLVFAYEDQIETEIIRYCKKGIERMFGKGENKEDQCQLLSLWFKSLFLPPKPQLPAPVAIIGEQQEQLYWKQMLLDNYFYKPFHPPCIPEFFC